MSATGWPAQQQAFAAALLDPRLEPPDFVLARTGATISSRFDVYRNNVHAGLIEALLATFPVTARLVSEESFSTLAREYLRHELPQAAALHEYGAGLPAFLRGWTAVASLPYLADVAALEHAWWQAYGAADAPVFACHALSLMDSTRLPDSRARLHPATRLLDSEHPVHGIWSVHQAEGEPAPVQEWQPECVLITRPDVAVQVRRITPVAHAFLDALRAAATLEDAAGAAFTLDPHFDPGTTLLQAIEAGAIQELHS